MSNDTQVLRATLETALARIEDMLADDDGQAFKEARKFLESARQLAEQPGFVMVPVEVVKFLTGEGPLDGLWFGENPFGLGGGKYWWRKHLFTARPLTASPTAPSTEASEPKRDLMFATVAMQQREEERIKRIVSGLEQVKQEHAASKGTP